MVRLGVVVLLRWGFGGGVGLGRMSFGWVIFCKFFEGRVYDCFVYYFVFWFRV